MNRDELRGAYAGWLGEFGWDWFGGLSFREEVSATAASRRFRRLAAYLRCRHPRVRWVLVGERGRVGGRFHFHFLLGGVPDLDPAAFRTEWNKIGGLCHLDVFDSELAHNGIRYMFKGLEPGKDYDVEVELNGARKRPSAGNVNGTRVREVAGTGRGQRVPHDLAAQDSRDSHQQALRTNPSQGSRGVVRKPQLPDYITGPPRKQAIEVRRVGKKLIVTLPLSAGELSKSGKSRVIATTRGVLPTLEEFGGSLIGVVANVLLFANEPRWRQRARAASARYDGRLK